MSEARSTAEKYLSATMTSDLRLRPERSSDADKILAAAYATRGDERMDLALKVFRLRASGDMAGAHALAERLGNTMREWAWKSHEAKSRTGRALRKRYVMTFGQAKGVAMTLLKWWQMPACKACQGHGHPRMMGAPVLDMTRDCEECRGAGVIPLERVIRQEYIECARWLVSEMEGRCAAVFDDMKKLS